jgi:hypothetical protein
MFCLVPPQKGLWLFYQSSEERNLFTLDLTYNEAAAVVLPLAVSNINFYYGIV